VPEPEPYQNYNPETHTNEAAQFCQRAEISVAKHKAEKNSMVPGKSGAEFLPDLMYQKRAEKGPNFS
jgi:hypothetical protein